MFKSATGLQSRFNQVLKLPLYRVLLVGALICAGINLVTSCLYYLKHTLTSWTWLGWALGMGLFILAFLVRREAREPLSAAAIIERRWLWAVGLGLTVLFVGTHLWNYPTAPWNHNGLFDDAGWDLHFLKSIIWGGHPFQAAVYVPGCSAAREVIFHLYLAPFFALFGADMLVFTGALLLLGYITFIFTVLLVHRLFRNIYLTALAGLLFNFLPLHYIHTFVGHRYASMAPLMMISIYLLVVGYQRQSARNVAISAILAGLCFASAIMGKQYLMGLAGGVILSLLFNYRETVTPANLRLTKIFLVGLVIASIPLLTYIWFDPGHYFMNEGGYTQAFLNDLKTQGLAGVYPFYQRMIDCLFNFTFYRWFLNDFVLIPLPYYLLLLPGIVVALARKQFTFVILALLSAVGAFIAGFSDYRVLHSSPFWIVMMIYAIHWLITAADHPRIGEYFPKFTVWTATGVILLAGWIPCVQYLYQKSLNPFSIPFFVQQDVAISRYLRDIVAGVPNPSTRFRHNEFTKLPGLPEPSFDTLICQNRGYAITHLFLYDYGDERIMAFSDQLPFNLMDEGKILTVNKRAIQNYPSRNKDLKLVWEVNEKTERIVKAFQLGKQWGDDQVLRFNYAGYGFELYILNIKNANIQKFQEFAAKVVL